MMRLSSAFLSLPLVVSLALVAAAAEEPLKYTLRYRFEPGQALRWEVVHRGRTVTTLADTTKETETVSKSIKLWRVTERAADGSTVFEHSVESVDMWQKITGRDEVRYNSITDKAPPRGFEQVARRVGTPLSQITIDPRGKVLHRKALIVDGESPSESQITIPLPEEPVAVGQTWSEPHEVVVPMDGGGARKILTRQVFTLASVKSGVATIEVATQILTPIHDPALEAKLIERGARGTVRFDLDAGRVLSQQIDLDKRVVGFRGADSSLHHRTRFTETLLPSQAELAQRPNDAK